MNARVYFKVLDHTYMKFYWKDQVIESFISFALEFFWKSFHDPSPAAASSSSLSTVMWLTLLRSTAILLATSDGLTPEHARQALPQPPFPAGVFISALAPLDRSSSISCSVVLAGVALQLYGHVEPLVRYHVASCWSYSSDRCRHLLRFTISRALHLARLASFLARSHTPEPRPRQRTT